MKKFFVIFVFLVVSLEAFAGGIFNLQKGEFPEVFLFEGGSYLYEEILTEAGGYRVTFPTKEGQWVLIDTRPAYGSPPANIVMAVQDGDGDGKVTVFFGRNINSYIAGDAIGPEASGEDYLVLSGSRKVLNGIPLTSNCDNNACSIFLDSTLDRVQYLISSEVRYLMREDYSSSSHPTMATPTFTVDNQLRLISVDLPQFNVSEFESVGVVITYVCYSGTKEESYFFEVPDSLVVSMGEETSSTPDVARIRYERKCAGGSDHYAIKIKFVVFDADADWGMSSDTESKRTGAYR